MTPLSGPLRRRHARAMWSVIAEPSDEVARRLRAVCGPEDALSRALHGSAEDLWQAMACEEPSMQRRSRMFAQIETAQVRWQSKARGVDIHALLADTAGAGIGFVTPEDAEWPVKLRDLQDAEPVGLWWRGQGKELEKLSRPTVRAVAMVGSRAATSTGEHFASAAAAELACDDVCIVSGGAFGIDAAAHRGALDAGGSTVAIMARGVDRFYPQAHAALFSVIEQRGLILAEVPPGTTPARWRFLARNRIIAGLADVSVVVEAHIRSGALNTARYAEEYSRLVAAVPGSVSSPASAGCHRLLRETGAVLVTSAAEIRELLPGADPVADPDTHDALDILSSTDRHIHDAIPPRGFVSLDVLVTETARDPAEIRSSVGRLELLGMVERGPRGVRRRRS